ncbi:hypothetical protein Pmar_PMAR003013 [Perkinsus marinus ATCC 50983]|uniref:Ubiquitin carboxyl-terminal hydrolase n=1 Tax=Perkinsus marinus (strain ATCC 50983 / TXsc) TaxID=423536 RepID=C5LR57_PERM5|nr:hypothetical protein Pmar_PMAR003013 [Perkinsus marinus ATCC 50983]EER00942.1 hypothetical protein Pmar_PMAR003013 [Perkinsus marinus ATCC 50983]|eukprot:XP_002768224.1 hypothetical protein Pmar_PMAR003013 [Perkinsus marinus ATCC 50983]
MANTTNSKLNKGRALLEKMGWQPGSGLGRQEQGMKAPLHVKQKAGTHATIEPLRVNRTAAAQQQQSGHNTSQGGQSSMGTSIAEAAAAAVKLAQQGGVEHHAASKASAVPTMDNPFGDPFQPRDVLEERPAAIDITTKPVGIKNLGSTCFVTCVLQCMLSIAEFTCLASQMKRGVKHYQQKHHRNHHHHHHDDDVDKQQQQQNTAHNTVKEKKENAPSNHGYYEVAAAMVDLFSKCQVNVEDLSTDSKPAVNPVRLLSALKRKYPKNPLFMDLAEEQDCHEFLSLLLDALHGCTHDSVTTPDPRAGGTNTGKDRGRLDDHNQCPPPSSVRWREYRSRNPSLITDMFSGMFRSRFMCHSCGHVTRVYEPIMDLSLPVPVEVGPEMRTSAGCSAAFRPSASAPDSLSLQGKGSTSNNGTVSLKSLIANYFVDEELTDFSCDKCHCKSTKATKSTKVTASPDILVIHLRRFTAQGRKINTAVSFPMECAKLVDRATTSSTSAAAHPCLEGSCSFQPYLDGSYRLLGLCVHVGTHLGTGHYISYVRRKASGGGARWWRCDDEKISLIDPDKVLAKQSQVYCLFFQKCSGPSNLPVPHSGYSLSNYVSPRPMSTR